jgi:hypothetical protein
MPRLEPDSYDPDQQAAEERVRRVAVLIAAQANDSGFPTNGHELEALIDAIRDRIPETQLSTGGGDPGGVSITLGNDDDLYLSASFGTSQTIGEVLRADGRLEGGWAGTSFGPGNTETRIELSEEAQADLTEIHRRLREQGMFDEDRPRFRGEEFIATLAPNSQPEGPVQVSAVELFADGFIVNYLVRDPVEFSLGSGSEFMPDLQQYAQAGIEPPMEDLLQRAQAAGGGNLSPGFRAEDDAGTQYLNAGAYSSRPGDVEVERGSVTFTPRVPEAARELRLSSYVGTALVRIPKGLAR